MYSKIIASVAKQKISGVVKKENDDVAGDKKCTHLNEPKTI